MDIENRAGGSTALGLSAPHASRGERRVDSHAHFAHPALNGSRPRALRAGVRPLVHNFLPSNDFLAHVQREKRRAERTKAPLSIMLYGAKSFDGGAAMEQLLEVLHRQKRETDILGHVGEGLVALLCPDTAASGMGVFMRKIEAHSNAESFTCVAATYPDHLFDSISDPGRSTPLLPSELLADSPTNVRPQYRLKRALDLALSIVALSLFAPIMLAVAAGVALTSRGPVIFRQTRIGKGGVPFSFYKFRSMFVDNDDAIHRKFVSDFISKGPATSTEPGGQNEAAVFKIAQDPRVTPIGRFIRRTSLDELPQLFNVIKGDMSLVGPRPPIPYEASDYQAWHLRRVLAVKPGITGLWQVEGRSRVTFNDMVRMDLRYVRNCSFGLDVKILLKTITVVLRHEGAA